MKLLERERLGLDLAAESAFTRPLSVCLGPKRLGIKGDPGGETRPRQCPLVSIYLAVM